MMVIVKNISITYTNDIFLALSICEGLKKKYNNTKINIVACNHKFVITLFYSNKQNHP